MEEKLLTIAETAEFLGVSIDTLRRWDKSGKLVAIRKEGGVHRYYRQSDLNLFAGDIQKTAYEWAKNGGDLSSQFYCANSSVFQGRISKLETFLSGLGNLGFLITSVAAEIGDNSFAHNLGKWPDTAGIFFGYDLAKRRIVLADRGVGILATLRQVRPQLASHLEAVQVAFTEIVSGRAPEARGNGLKFVRKVILENKINLYFKNGDAEVRVDAEKGELRFTRGAETIRGCFAVIMY